MGRACFASVVFLACHSSPALLMESSVEYASTDAAPPIYLDQFQAVFGVYSIRYIAVVGKERVRLPLTTVLEVLSAKVVSSLRHVRQKA